MIDDLHSRAAGWIDTDPEVVNDPYPLWEDLREQCPILHEPGHGVWLVSRYEDCQTIARDSATWSSILAAKGPIRGEPGEHMDLMRSQLAAVAQGKPCEGDIDQLIDAALREQSDRLQHTDPPGYQRYRSLISRWFTPGRVAALEPRVREATADLITRFPDSGSFDFLRGFAGPLPGTIIADLLGVPAHIRADFVEWDSVFAGNTKLQEDPERLAASMARRERVLSWLAAAVVERRQSPGDDLVSELVSATLDDGELITDTHAKMIAHTFHIGGQETTSKLLTSSARIVAADGELQSTLRQEPALVPAFVEEALRIQSPTQGLFRVARTDTEVSGQSFPAGAMVQLLWGSANRDSSVFDHADRIDLERPNLKSHLAFGHGIHLCPGNHLARLEARVAFEELLARTEHIGLASSNTFEYMPSHVMRGLSQLDLEITRR